MVQRHFWVKKINALWNERSIIWLCGVRRAGKTFLCGSISNTEYYDCELISVRSKLEDPEDFLKNNKNKRIIIDEIHKLANPSELLKIAADYFPDIKIIATGSSTLGASKKFKDTLTGRKRELYLTPMITDDLKDFKSQSLEHRFLHGGLPPMFLSKKFPEQDFQEWIDAFWAKDIQELFKVEKKFSFQKFMELLFMQSGSIFEATSFTKFCEANRQTINNYLTLLEETFVVNVVRPFHSGKSSEIIKAPKVYGFDTGFVSYFKRWNQLRAEDFGLLWEHFVLNEICAKLQIHNICYWRDKRGHEIDFILSQRGGPPIVIECKWKSGNYNLRNIELFRKHYPQGENYIVSSNEDKKFTKEVNGIKIHFVGIENLIADILGKD